MRQGYGKSNFIVGGSEPETPYNTLRVRPRIAAVVKTSSIRSTVLTQLMNVTDTWTEHGFCM